MTLLAAHWLLPLFSMTLPAGTFRRLLDLVHIDLAAGAAGIESQLA